MKNILFTLALLISFNSFGQTAKEYFDNGIEKITNEDYYGAIADFTKAIEIDPDYDYAYARRGDVNLYSKKDYYAAIADYTKAIEIDPNYDYAYASRANAKEELGDLNGACADWKEAARLGNTLAAEWVADQCN